MKRCLLLFLSALCVVNCYKVLVIFPIASRSHYILGNGIAKGLAKAGHDVTMVSGIEDKSPKNYKEVPITGLYEKLVDKYITSIFDMENEHPWINSFVMNQFGALFVEETFKHPNFKAILNEKFDVIVIEQFKNDAMKALGCHFDAPVIMFSTVGTHSWVNLDIGNPAPPSYVPDIFLSYTSKMNLWQRTYNTLTVLISYLNAYFIHYPQQERMVKEYLPHCTHYDINNVSLYFANMHESTSEPVPKVPNVISVGGYHVDPPKGLPKDLKEYMDNAKDGVVYFSMGSNIPASQMPVHIREAIIKTLGKLKQKVLWKYDLEDLPNKPSNFRLSKWFPQADILAHPNVKLFITHGGMLSTLETIYHGVPVLTLPVFGDQKLNAARAEAFGYGRKLVFSTINDENFSEAVNDLLNDPKYQAIAKYRSKLFHDRPLKPMDEIVYWTEYIARHRGAPHLVVAGKNLPWYQYLLIDVMLLIGVLVTLFVYIIKLVCKQIFCHRSQKRKTE